MQPANHPTHLTSQLPLLQSPVTQPNPGSTAPPPLTHTFGSSHKLLPLLPMLSTIFYLFKSYAFFKTQSSITSSREPSQDPVDDFTVLPVLGIPC